METDHPDFSPSLSTDRSSLEHPRHPAHTPPRTGAPGAVGVRAHSPDEAHRRAKAGGSDRLVGAFASDEGSRRSSGSGAEGVPETWMMRAMRDMRAMRAAMNESSLYFVAQEPEAGSLGCSMTENTPNSFVYQHRNKNPVTIPSDRE